MNSTTEIGGLDFRNSSDVYFSERDVLMSSDAETVIEQQPETGLELAAHIIERWYQKR